MKEPASEIMVLDGGCTFFLMDIKSFTTMDGGMEATQYSFD